MENEIKEWSLNNYEEVFINKYLKGERAEPEIVEANQKKIVYRLHNCVFFELAVKTPEIMCDVLHESFHEGASNTGQTSQDKPADMVGKRRPVLRTRL